LYNRKLVAGRSTRYNDELRPGSAISLPEGATKIIKDGQKIKVAFNKGKAFI
jgi:hypothetical protein